MRKEQSFRTDWFNKTSLEGRPAAAEGTARPVHTGREIPLRRQMAAGLIGALLLLCGMLVVPATSSARVAVGISVNFGPPALPVYAQPPCPGPGYMWTPGYWAYTPASGYYWVPGAWVVAPFVGALWTPGYWGFGGGLYLWHPGYWGTRVGFYGGINYGFGYTGDGYHGGYWNHGRFFYNRAFNRLEGRRFDHVYYRREDDHFRGERVSYFGGPHGINVRPTREQMNAVRFRRSGPVGAQVRHEQFARINHVQRNAYRGRPGGPRGPQGHAAAERRGHAEHQDRGHGGNGHGHDNGHGHGGQR
jgi:WXXGXW repeat (2 copies)